MLRQKEHVNAVDARSDKELSRCQEVTSVYLLTCLRHRTQQALRLNFTNPNHVLEYSTEMEMKIRTMLWDMAEHRNDPQTYECHKPKRKDI